MKKLLLLITIALISINCTTATKEKLVWDANNKMNEVFFIGENIQYFKKKSNDYMKAVESKFNERHIKNAWYQYDEKILNVDKKLKEKIESVNPKYILTISLRTISNGGAETFILEIFDTEKQKIVWDGSLYIAGFGGPKNFSEKLLKELEKEKIIEKIDK